VIQPNSTTALSFFAALTLLPAAAPLAASLVEVERATSKAFAAGDSGNYHSRVLAATPDGRFLLIHTEATNLLAGIDDTNGLADLVVYDRETQSFDWVTVSHLDGQRPAWGQNYAGAISDDGRFVGFASEGLLHAPGTTGGRIQIYLFDRHTRTTTKVSRPPGDPLGHGNLSSEFGFLSADGRYLAYSSQATNLVAGSSDANSGTDVFHYDRTTGVNTLVSHQANVPGATVFSASRTLGMSADGRNVLYENPGTGLLTGFADNNGSGNDLYLWDRDTGGSTLVSHAAGSPLAGAGADVYYGRLAADGSRVAFSSPAANLVAGFTDNNGGEHDSFVFERSSGSLQLVSGLSATATHDRATFPMELSADGRYLFFHSRATDLLTGLVRPADDGRGLFRFDTGTRAISLLNHKPGQPAAIALGQPDLFRAASGGEAAIFDSGGSELVPGQTGGGRPIYFHDLNSGNTRLVSHAAGQPLAGETAEPVALSADHRYATFDSRAASLAAGDPRDYWDVFVADLDLAGTERVSSAALAGLEAAGGTFDFLESIPAAGLFLFHAADLSPMLPGITNLPGKDPLLFDPRTGALAALLAPGGVTPAGDSRATFLPDGLNYLLFFSGGAAGNLVPGLVDGNGAGTDLYAGNRATGSLQLISSSGASATTTANQAVAEQAVFSANGRFVAYATFATDAVAGVTDANGAEDLILHDRQLGTRVLVSRSATSASQTANARSLPAAMSPDGEILIFYSSATNLIDGFVDLNNPSFPDYYLYRRGAGTTTLLSRSAFSPTTGGSGFTFYGLLSADGRQFVFGSMAANLLAGMTNNGANIDTFLYDTATGVISLVSHRPGSPLHGVNNNVFPQRISADGRFILLNSPDSLLTPGTYPVVDDNVFVYDRLAARTTLISHLPGQPQAAFAYRSSGLAMSDDGRFVIFATGAPNVVPGQTAQGFQASFNLYLVDRATGQRRLLSRGLDGPVVNGNDASGAPALLGPAARHTLFLSQSTNLSLHHAWGFEVYLAELDAGAGELFSDGFELGDTSLWSQMVGGN
jgi:Tol biopolymer transport system component